MNLIKMTSLQNNNSSFQTNSDIVIYTFENQTFRVAGSLDNPQFVVKDICNILGITNVTNAMKSIPEEWVGDFHQMKDTTGRKQNMLTVYEAGFYHLVMRSDKEVAKRFQKWACGEVFPSIRKKGEYILQEYKEKLEQKEKEIEAHQKEIVDKDRLLWKSEEKIQKIIRSKNLMLNRRFYDWKVGHAVYLYHDSKCIYKIGKTQNISSREENYKTGKMVYVKYCTNSDLTEKVVHHMLNKYKLINKQEWFNFPDKSLAIQTIDLAVHILDNNIENFIQDTFKILHLQSDNMDKEMLTNLHKRKNFKNTSPTLIKEDLKESLDTKEDLEESLDTKEDLEETLDTKEDLDEPLDTKEDLDESLDTKEPERRKKIKQPLRCIDTKNFDKFIQDCCELGEKFYDTKVNLRDVYRFWSRQCNKDDKKELEKYLSSKFVSSHHFYEIDSSRRNTFKGVKVRPLTYNPKPFETELESKVSKFIVSECKVDYRYRISFADFYKYFETYNTQTLSYTDKQEIKDYLSEYFLAGSIFTSSEDKKVNKLGVWGLGVESDNFGLKGYARHIRSVEVLDTSGNVINTYESCIIASQSLGISYRSLNDYIKCNKLVNGKYYQYSLK
jgi:prophage antirepressor-like protein